jgi:hypothetical protein
MQVCRGEARLIDVIYLTSAAGSMNICGASFSLALFFQADVVIRLQMKERKPQSPRDHRE